jgi:hypothetical protein
MARSYNGWPASPNLKTRVIEPVKGVRLRIADNQNLADIFTYLVQQFHRRVDDVTKPHPADDWGFAYRANVNNPNSLSNHSSGTAIDLDATENPNGVPTSRVMTPRQIAEVHEILDELDGVIRWGGDYQNTPDAMHFEVLRGPGSLQKTARKVRRLNNKPDPKSRGAHVDAALENLRKARAKKGSSRWYFLNKAKEFIRRIKPS